MIVKFPLVKFRKDLLIKLLLFSFFIFKTIESLFVFMWGPQIIINTGIFLKEDRFNCRKDKFLLGHFPD